MIAGIDYSLSSPCICIANERKPFSFESCKFLCMVKSKRLPSQIKNIKIIQNYDSFYPQMHRYQYLASNTACFCVRNGVQTVLIEDYAFAAHGRVFHIGENCGIMKNLLSLYGVQMETAAPATIKKFATGKGNANKNDLFEKFNEETGVNLLDLLKLKKTKHLPAPVTDIVDAYNLCHYYYQRKRNVA